MQRNIITVVLFLYSITFLCSQRVKLGVPSFDGMMSLGGHTADTILFIESFTNKPLFTIRKNQKTTMGSKEGMGLLTLSSDESIDKLFIRNSTFNPTRMHVSSLNPVYSTSWKINALTWPLFPNLASFSINHEDFGNVLNIQGDGKWGIGLNPSYSSTLNVDGNIRFSGALRPGGNAGLPGQVLKYVNNTVPGVWSSPTNEEYNSYIDLSLNNNATLNTGNTQVLANYPIDVSGPRTMIEFNFSTVVQGDGCLLCGKARGYVVVSILPVGGFPEMYSFQNDHYLYYFFDVDANKLQSVNGVGSFDMHTSMTSGPHILSISIVSLEGLFRTGTGNLTTTGSDDYFINFKVLK